MELLDAAVFPSNIYCLVCGAMIDESRPYSLCDECVRKLHWINEGVQPDGSMQRVCAKCGKALLPTYQGEYCYDCMIHPHAFTKGYSCLTYGLHERELMMDLKYNGKSYIAAKMGDILFDRMAGPIVSGELSVDIVVPVPVSTDRLRKRGYNQAELMARRFVKRWRDAESFAKPPACSGKVLYRCRDTQMLRSLNPAERAMAMEGAFAVRASERQKINGKNVLLIDDIYTTGATADACSKALIQGGAVEVFLLTLSSGGNRKPGEK